MTSAEARGQYGRRLGARGLRLSGLTRVTPRELLSSAQAGRRGSGPWPSSRGPGETLGYMFW